MTPVKIKTVAQTQNRVKDKAGELTLLFFPQMFHDSKGESSSSHQGSQNPQNDPHHVVVTHSHHCANVMDLTINGDLENKWQHQAQIIYLLVFNFYLKMFFL